MREYIIPEEQAPRGRIQISSLWLMLLILFLVSVNGLSCTESFFDPLFIELWSIFPHFQVFWSAYFPTIHFHSWRILFWRFHFRNVLIAFYHHTGISPTFRLSFNSLFLFSPNFRFHCWFFSLISLNSNIAPSTAFSNNYHAKVTSC